MERWGRIGACWGRVATRRDSGALFTSGQASTKRPGDNLPTPEIPDANSQPCGKRVLGTRKGGSALPERSEVEQMIDLQNMS